eukprot:scaffold20973_cov53-Phaeocystis_antarctica.AAC.15
MVGAVALFLLGLRVLSYRVSRRAARASCAARGRERGNGKRPITRYWESGEYSPDRPTHSLDQQLAHELAILRAARGGDAECGEGGEAHPQRLRLEVLALEHDEVVGELQPARQLAAQLRRTRAASTHASVEAGL